MIFSFISVLNSVKTLLILKGVTYEITVTEMFMGMIYFFGRLGWWKSSFGQNNRNETLAIGHGNIWQTDEKQTGNWQYLYKVNKVHVKNVNWH